MKPLSCLAIAICLSCAAWADEIHLNLDKTPEQVGIYYMADKKNFGEISDQQSNILRIDKESWPMHVGDWSAGAATGYMVKYFLLFRLPPTEGKKLSCATLRLTLGQLRNEAAGTPLQPLMLFHAKNWEDANWENDTASQGLRLFHFGDREFFSDQLPLCDPTSKPGTIDLDVTTMIQSDYERNPEPVAAFRMEMSNHETFDITDEYGNFYGFWGTTLNSPDKIPTLVLSFED